MGESLISWERYEYLRRTKRPYEGFVWTREGKVYHMELHYDTYVTDAPSWPHSPYGIVRGTVFFDVVKHQVITEQMLGNNDVLYSEDGDFIMVLEATDPVAGKTNSASIPVATKDIYGQKRYGIFLI